MHFKSLGLDASYETLSFIGIQKMGADLSSET
ncbi:hypothetical protein METHP15_220013 [Pseudomonas sp. P15-2025]